MQNLTEELLSLAKTGVPVFQEDFTQKEVEVDVTLQNMVNKIKSLFKEPLIAPTLVIQQDNGKVDLMVAVLGDPDTSEHYSNPIKITLSLRD